MITFNQSTEDNGDYAIGVRVRGTYQMLAKPMRYLKKRTGNLTIGNSGIANVNLNFVCGDAISDNTIDLMDFAQVSMLFGLARDDADYDPRTDLNGDGEINLLDLAIVMKNFGKQGDE